MMEFVIQDPNCMHGKGELGPWKKQKCALGKVIPDIAKERYLKGEITKKELEEILRSLI